MDKIIEKLSGVLSTEDLNEIKNAFESAVDEKVQSKLDEETVNLAKKADEFCQKKIEKAVAERLLNSKISPTSTASSAVPKLQKRHKRS